MHIKTFLRQYSTHDVAELMAMDNLKDPEYLKKVQEEIEAEEMTAEQQSAAIIALLGGKK